MDVLADPILYSACHETDALCGGPPAVLCFPMFKGDRPFGLVPAGGRPSARGSLALLFLNGAGLGWQIINLLGAPSALLASLFVVCGAMNAFGIFLSAKRLQGELRKQAEYDVRQLSL